MYHVHILKTIAGKIRGLRGRRGAPAAEDVKRQERNGETERGG
jgi:hypothetical protein